MPLALIIFCFGLYFHSWGWVIVAFIIALIAANCD